MNTAAAKPQVRPQDTPLIFKAAGVLQPAPPALPTNRRSSTIGNRGDDRLRVGEALHVERQLPGAHDDDDLSGRRTPPATRRRTDLELHFTFDLVVGG